MMFWLVLKLEISMCYNILKDFGFFAKVEIGHKGFTLGVKAE
jgi:hypothetical protein